MHGGSGQTLVQEMNYVGGPGQGNIFQKSCILERGACQGPMRNASRRVGFLKYKIF